MVFLEDIKGNVLLRGKFVFVPSRSYIFILTIFDHLYLRLCVLC